VGFEPTPVYTDQNSHYLHNVSYLKLESGALDRSAILSFLISSIISRNQDNFCDTFKYDLIDSFLVAYYPSMITFNTKYLKMIQIESKKCFY
jgi:hypothetical protein